MRIFTCALILTTLTFPALAQEPPRRDSVIYEPSLEDPVLKEIRTRNEKADKDRDARTTVIRARQKADQKARKDARKKLRATLPENEVPASPEIFTRHFHFPPQAQYYTGTCWAYGATSLLESEIFRIADKKIKMSEMHTVYYEYIEKTRRFVQERGDSNFAEGSQHNAVTRMWKLYGAVPLEVYAGVLAEDGLHDHTRMSREMTDFLQHVKAKDVWDEEWVVGVIRSILDKYMGPPPTEFKYKGRQYTPLSFLEKVCKINPDDYLGFMSSMAHPFYSQSEFEVPDNWWKDASYHNVPIEVFIDRKSVV